MTNTEKLLRELIALPSVNPAFLPAQDPRAGEQRVAEFLAATAARAGLEVELQTVAPGSLESARTSFTPWKGAAPSPAGAALGHGQCCRRAIHAEQEKRASVRPRRLRHQRVGGNHVDCVVRNG